MSKNMTRKGLALGAAASLLSAGFIALPASAAGINDGSVSLVPTTGAEYDIIAGADLKLSANMATGVLGTGKYLKFHVADALGKTSVLYSGSSQYSVTTDGTADFEVVVGAQAADDDTVKVYIASGDHKLKVGDLVNLSGIADLDDGVSGQEIDDATDAWAVDVVAATYVQFKVPGASYTAAVNGGSAGTGKNGAVTMKLYQTVPDGGEYVFDTKSDTNTSDKTIQISSTDENVTQTVVVTAWVDSNDDGDIDSTEYASPARTVRFLASTEITPTVTFDPIAVGASSVVAKVTLSPTINGLQMTNGTNGSDLNTVAKAMTVDFTRPGSATAVVSATSAYSNVTKTWTITSAAMDAAGWGITQPDILKSDGTTAYDGVAAVTVSKYSITKNVVTITTSGAHALEVGDRIKLDNDGDSAFDRGDSPTSGTAQYVTVATVPTTTTFTFAEKTSAGAAATGDDVAEVGSLTGTIIASKILRNEAVTGTYSAQVKLFKYQASGVGSDALAALGTKVSTTVGATVVSSADTAPTFTGVATATVSADGKVKTGTKSANYLLTAYDEDGDAVGAGIAAKITATTVTSAGTVTINGATVVSGSSFVANTDANGQIAIAVTNSSGAAGESIVMDAVVQGVSATQFTTTWEDAVYSIYDVADVNKSNSVRNRAAAEGASHTFSLRVHDQWLTAIDGTTYRLKATVQQNSVTVSTQIVPISNGTATLTVADAATGYDSVVTLEFQKATAGVWATIDTTAVNDWAGSAGNDLAGVTIKYYSQTDAITFNADAATLPSGTPADLTADVTTAALKAVDLRFTTGTAGVYAAATKAVFGGKITNSNTGVAKSGASVTVAAPGVLFKVGDVWANDSLTFLTNDGTFSVEAYSQVASAAKAVTVTTGTLSKTVSLVFKSVASAKGYSVVLTTPASVQKGSTYRIDGQIKDVNGNGVAVTTAGTGANPTLTVTYMGLGLVSGTLPTTTDKDGKFYFYVLVGSNDVGTATVTATYDADGTGTTSTASTTSATVYVGQAAPGTGTVNVGSFNGKLVVYAKDLDGKRISWKVGGNWGKDVAVGNTLNRFDRLTPRKGVTLSVAIYVDGVLTLTKSVVTR